MEIEVFVYGGQDGFNQARVVVYASTFVVHCWIPSSVFNTIEQVCSNFLWGSTPEESKFHWIRWTQLCYPVEESGVGFRRLRDVYTAFSCKL